MLLINTIRYFSELFITYAEEKERYLQEVLRDAERDLAAGRPGAALARAWYIQVVTFDVEICIWAGTRLAWINTWIHTNIIL